MKILTGTDGSDHSFRAIEEAIKIAEGINDAEITVVNVDEVIPDIPYFSEESLQTMEERNKAERKDILAEAEKIFEGKNIKFNTMIKKGHPAATIIELAAEGKFDMVVIGSRGMGGIKKALLGSVSNAVAQAVETNVLIVK